MTYLIKFTLALFIGSLAAIGNWLYMSLQTRPTEYVAVANNLKVGQMIDENDLLAVPVPGDPRSLNKALIPYGSRAILLGRKASRAYIEGDVVLSRDLVADPSDAAWDVIGPFELISVGERFKQETGRETSSSSTRGDTVTIAVDADFDQQTSHLLSVLAGQATHASTKASQTQASEILAVQVVPSRRSDGGLPLSSDIPIVPAAKRVYQTVSLKGITSVPAVLLEGDFIRFVVPRSAF